MTWNCSPPLRWMRGISTKKASNQHLQFCKVLDVFSPNCSFLSHLFFSIVCLCGRYLFKFFCGILLYIISILWCAEFDDDNEVEPVDYHDYCCSEAVLWAPKCCVLFGRRIRKKEREEWITPKDWAGKCRLESPATVKAPTVLWLSPEAGPQSARGALGQAVIRRQHMALLRVHNLNAYM